MFLEEQPSLGWEAYFCFEINNETWFVSLWPYLELICLGPGRRSLYICNFRNAAVFLIDSNVILVQKSSVHKQNEYILQNIPL